MNTRFVITYINRHGNRALLGPNQGQLHATTRELAESRCKSLVANNSFNTLVQHYGPNCPGTFEVREAECYEHGDLKSIYFDK